MNNYQVIFLTLNSCHHCERFKNTWIRLQQKLKSSQIICHRYEANEDGIKIKKINLHSVNAFPTVKLIKNNNIDKSAKEINIPYPSVSSKQDSDIMFKEIIQSIKKNDFSKTISINTLISDTKKVKIPKNDIDAINNINQIFGLHGGKDSNNIQTEELQKIVHNAYVKASTQSGGSDNQLSELEYYKKQSRKYKEKYYKLKLSLL